MKNKIFVGIWAILFGAVVSMFGLVNTSYAASVNMYLSPAISSVNVGQTLAVGIHVNSGDENINAVQANLVYTASNLDFVNISPASTFPVESEASGGNGAVHIGRGTVGSVKGDQLIATVNFKAKTAGNAEVSFAADSSATDSSTNKPINLSTAGANYTISDGGNTNKSGVANDKIPPKITGVKVTDINYRSVKISWKTSEPAQSEISYGTTKAYGVSAVDTRYMTDHSMTVSSEALMPATTYHYKITNKDTAGNSTSSADGTFTTKGSVIVVNVVGKSKRAVKDATVTVDNAVSQKTGSNGQVTFSNLRAGYHTITASWKDKSASTSVTTLIPQKQPVKTTVELDVNQISTAEALLIVVLLALLAIVLANQLKKSKSKQSSVTSSNATQSTEPNKKVHRSKKK